MADRGKEEEDSDEEGSADEYDESDDEEWRNPFQLDPMRTIHDPVYCTAWKNGMLAVGMGQDDARVMIFNRDLSLRRAKIIGTVMSMSWNASGEVLACAVDDKIVLFNQELKIQRVRAPTPRSIVSCLAWYDTRDILAASSFVTIDDTGQQHERIDFLDSSLSPVARQPVVGEVQPSMAWHGNMLAAALQGSPRVIDSANTPYHKLAALSLADDNTVELSELRMPGIPANLQWRHGVLAFSMGHTVRLVNARLEALRTLALAHPVASLAWHADSGWLAFLTTTTASSGSRLGVFRDPLQSEVCEAVAVAPALRGTVSLEWCGSNLALADRCGRDGLRLQPVPHLRWHLVRAAVRARTICVFWLKATVEKRYAPGGCGRKRDLAAFEADMTQQSS